MVGTRRRQDRDYCREHQRDLVGGAQNHGGPLMDGGGLYVHHSLPGSGERLAAGLFDDHGHGVCFVHEPQLAFGRFLGGRIQKNAAFEQDPVHVGHHGAGVAAGVAVALSPVQVALKAVGEGLAIAFVDGVGLVAVGDGEMSFDAHEGADAGIEHEHVDALADGEYEHRGRAVEYVAGRHLFEAWLQQRVLRPRRPPIVGEDAENGPDPAADIEVRGAVERIEQDAVARNPFAILAQDHRFLVLFRCDDGDAFPPPQRAQQDLVGEHVELLLHLALHVLRPDAAEYVLEARAAHLVRDDFGRNRQRREDPGEGPGGLRIARLLLQDMPLQGHDEHFVAGGLEAEFCGGIHPPRMPRTGTGFANGFVNSALHHAGAPSE